MREYKYELGCLVLLVAMLAYGPPARHQATSKGPISAVIVEETDQGTALTQDQIAAKASSDAVDYMAAKGYFYAVVDRGVPPPKGQPLDATTAAAISAASQAKLPCLVVLDTNKKPLLVTPITDEATLMATLKKYGGQP